MRRRDFGLGTAASVLALACPAAAQKTPGLDAQLTAFLDAEYEALITNRIILTPSVEADLPFSQDAEIGVGAFGPSIEIGARLSYDLIDRAVAPYIGVHYERSFGDTADFAREDGGDDDAVFAVVGLRLMF